MIHGSQQGAAEVRDHATGAYGLVVGVGSRVCFVPLGHVIETMRPLPVESAAGLPPFVKGLSIVRGAPVPVVDLAMALGADGDGQRPSSRFVLLRLGERRVALLVDTVVGVREFDAASTEEMPPLLRGSGAEVASRLGALDAKLMLVLEASRILTDEVWRRIAALEPIR
jgi:purine-binding chemotaxis protein CheW